MTQPPIPAPQRPAQQPDSPAQFPAIAADDVPWARQATTAQPATTRNRRLVRDLPGWDPLPPGEILVQRHRRG